jgi:hypothetical protein
MRNYGKIFTDENFWVLNMYNYKQSSLPQEIKTNNNISLLIFSNIQGLRRLAKQDI